MSATTAFNQAVSKSKIALLTASVFGEDMLLLTNVECVLVAAVSVCSTQ
jgi:hypothetical protein